MREQVEKLDILGWTLSYGVLWMGQHASFLSFFIPLPQLVSYLLSFQIRWMGTISLQSQSCHWIRFSLITIHNSVLLPPSSLWCFLVCGRHKVTALSTETSRRTWVSKCFGNFGWGNDELLRVKTYHLLFQDI